MNIYSILKINRYIKSPFIKSLGIWAMHMLNKRYLVVFFDPVLACNLRCKMCYFSNEEKRKTLQGVFAQEDLKRVAEVVFPQALKLQIGCGAEPSLFKHNVAMLKLAKAYAVPYISYTTNANLLTEEEINSLLDAGLDEFTISLHGVRKATYEDLMEGASYEKFMQVLGWISKAKAKFPDFKLRINYTVNEQNITELNDFFDEFKDVDLDVLQVRPIQDIGGVLHSIQEKKEFNEQFNELTAKLKTICSEKKITYIAPSVLEDKATVNKTSSIMDAVYCYISPKAFWHEDLDWRNETFRQYSKRVHYGSKMFKRIFSKKELTNSKLNYDIN